MNQELALQLGPDWDTVKGVWSVSQQFFSDQGLHEDTVYSLSMITQELLENAVKYGRFRESEDGITLGLRVNTREVTIEVKSPVEPDDTKLRLLDDTIQWIRGFQDPFEAYVERLRAVAVRPPRENESGLGLVRIAYEGQAILDFYITEQSELAISAVHRFL